METLIEFGRGPLFRFSFVVMLLGLLRLFLLTFVNMREAYSKNTDHIIPWQELWNKTFLWLIPLKKLWSKKPLYSTVSFLWHIGLILVPLFLAAHVILWDNAVGFSWLSLPQNIADYLTMLTILTGLTLFFMRVLTSGSRYLSRFQDVMLPLLLTIPFITGYFCGRGVSAGTYQALMVLHIYSGNLIMIVMPFSKVAHCVLMPLSQFVTGISWKFPEGAGDRVIETLGYGDKPTWVEKPRINGRNVKVPEGVKEAKA